MLVASLVLAIATMLTPGPVIPAVVAAFAVLFARFDVLEVAHQIGVGRLALAGVALAVLALQGALGAMAIRLLQSTRRRGRAIAM